MPPRSQLPTNLPSNPTYRKVNPADAPIMILALHVATCMPKPGCTTRLDDPGAEAGAGTGRGAGGRGRRLAAGRARRRESDGAQPLRPGAGRHPQRAGQRPTPTGPRAQIADDGQTWSLSTTDHCSRPTSTGPLMVAYSNGAPVRLGDVATCRTRSRTSRAPAFATASRRCC